MKKASGTANPEALERRHPDLNRGIADLQSAALPLGYGAVYAETAYKKLERLTRLELATSTLARWRSTR